MASLAGQFEEELNRLFRARTHWLRTYVWPTAGKAPKINRKTLQGSIERLQQLAETEYLKSAEANRTLNGYEIKRQWHPKKNKGHGVPAKRNTFGKWYQTEIASRNCVYAFWSGSKCLYVGRTLNGEGRPSSHFSKYWFAKATRLDVYGIRLKTKVPRFECMLTHQFDPYHADKTPSAKKYTAYCPICVGKKDIKDEVERIFRLK